MTTDDDTYRYGVYSDDTVHADDGYDTYVVMRVNGAYSLIQG